MNEIKVPVEILNAILGYLGTRPYQEVFNLIQSLQDVGKAQIVPKVGDNDGGKVDTEGD